MRHHRADAFEEGKEPLSGLQGANLYRSSWVHWPSVSLFPCAFASEMES